MNTLAVLAVLSLVLATPAAVQSAVAGVWEGQTNGGAAIVLDLKVDGKTLTGTLTRDGQPATISDGQVSGNAITFKVTLNEQPETISGELAGDELKVWLDRQGRERAIALKRAKPAPSGR
jgi:opacity protein-like surface antigen